MSQLLQIENVSLDYVRRGRRTHALRNVSLDIAAGEVLGIVGESGSGKSTLARCVTGLATPDRGEIRFGGERLDRRRSIQQRRHIQMVFQDPRSALNPRMSVFRLIEEGWRTHRDIAPHDARAAAAELLRNVGLDPALLSRRQSQLSGGQAQRVGIARALAVSPDLLICDEAVSALDVSVQTQVLELLARIRRELDLTMMFISHDLGVIRRIADRVAVMYLGEVVEVGDVDEIFERPEHPYTRTLLDAALDLAVDELP